MLCLLARCNLSGGRLPERPMGADCKSVAKASQVRILYLPPPGQSLFLASAAGLGVLIVRRASAAVSKATATASRSSGNRWPYLSSVSTADLCPSSFWTTFTLAPSLMARGSGFGAHDLYAGTNLGIGPGKEFPSLEAHGGLEPPRQLVRRRSPISLRRSSSSASATSVDGSGHPAPDPQGEEPPPIAARSRWS